MVPSLDQYLILNQLLSNSGGSSSNIITESSFGRAFTNLLYSGDLHFAPAGEMTSSLINFMNETYTQFNTLTIHVHESEGAAVNYILDNLDSPALALIALRQVSVEKVNYVIRQNYTTLPNTNEYIYTPTIGLDTDYQNYLVSGFLTIQQAVDRWVFNYTGVIPSNPDSIDEVDPICSAVPNPVLIPYPTEAYDQNPFYQSVGFLLGLAMVMATMYPMSRLVKSVVEEKESRMREVMKIMGLGDFAHRLSWFLSGFLLFFWISVSTTYLTGITFLTHSDPVLLFAYFFFFAMSEINFSFLVSVFFSSSKLAAIVAPVVLFAAILPRFIFINTNNNEQVVGKSFSCLLSPTAFTFGAEMISDLEYGGVGIQFHNMFVGDFNFGTVLLLMFWDFFLYGILAFYFDQVLQQEHGTPKHPLFLLQWRYWCPSCSRNRDRWQRLPNHTAVEGDFTDLDHPDEYIVDMPEFFERLQKETPASSTTSVQASSEEPVELMERKEGDDPIEPTEILQNPHSQHSAEDNSHIEPIPRDLRSKARVRIKGLHKRYPDGKLAVRDLSLSMMEGQITCLLGHNGAGKSTTISVLTGMLEATSGEVSIYGQSLRWELPAIRQMTGICPQHNVLFPLLTVQEHLRFFGKVKGIYGVKLRETVDSVIAEVGLTEKRHVLSSALSGGMKRKLSLAIALVGNPKFVLLDEPTSGMDPYSRRSTWELLNRCKVGRVVLLTTHFMDEADTLADRIAIMSEGHLRCSGSSLFLKNRFGVGYLLSMSRDLNAHTDSLRERPVGHPPVSAITTEMQKVVKECKVVSNVAGEVIYQLPLKAVPLFPRLFSMLKESAEDLGVSSYGISITTLEHVFISLAREGKGLVIDNADDDLETYDSWGKLMFYSRLAFLQGCLILNFFGRYLYRCGGATMDRVGCSADCDGSGPPQTVSGSEGVETGEPVAMAVVSASATSDGVVAPYASIESAELMENKVEVTKSKKSTNDGSYGAVEMVDFASSGTKTGLEEEKSEETEGLEEENWVSDGTSKGSTWVQLTELLRKRWIIASRDVKGFFFQVVFPAIQIMLIMLILTVSVNPAGHTIILNGGMFEKYADVTPNVQLANWNASNSLDYTLGYSSYMDTRYEDADTLNSTALSWKLLDEDEFRDNRYGAFVFRDSIPLNLTVDWDWVRENIEPILENTELINELLETSGFNVSIGDFLVDNLDSFELNVTELFSNNTAFDSVEGFLEDQFNITLSDTQVGDIEDIDVGSITYNETSNEFTLFNVTLLIAGVEVSVGQLTVSSDVLLDALPEGRERYFFDLPSPYTVMHNSSSPHGMAAFQGELIQALFRNCSGSASTRYLVKNHPLPITLQQSIEIKIILSLLTSIFILVPLCYIPASFVSFLVKERFTKSKHLQIVSSVSPYLYWTATYLWDMCLFTILSGFVIISFFIFGDAAEIFINSAESTLGVLLLLLTYGLSAIPLSYLYSLGFDNFATAQISIMAINFSTGFVAVLAYYIMINVPDTREIGETLVHVFRFFPPYNIGEGLINLSAAFYSNEILDQGISYFRWEVIGRNLVFMVAEAVGYFLAVLLTEFPPLKQIFYRLDRYRVSLAGTPPAPKTSPDEDIIAEERRVEQIFASGECTNWRQKSGNAVRGKGEKEDSSGTERDLIKDPEGENKLDDEESNNSPPVLVLKNLVKTYPPSILGGKPKFAVRGMSLSCSEGERFGLLGINGAGKTTTLGVLTGDLQLSSGEVLIAGRPLSDPVTKRMIGYCPQVDPLLELMNGYETLWFFGRIRGIPPGLLRRRVNSLIQEVGLQNFAHKPCGTYSGGNKRKLSLAIALVGDPRVLFLDEPSTGMDPEARRHMWTVIEKVSKHRSVLLISHSMEEVEALCSRVGVMVSGRMQCLGSSQHLKSKYGGGYQVEVRCAESHVEACLSLCQQTLPNCVLDEKHGGYLRLKVDRSHLDLATTFQAFEDHKKELRIFDYSVSQSSLEQVFIQFAREQEEETGVVAGMVVPFTQNNGKNDENDENDEGGGIAWKRGDYSPVVPMEEEDTVAPSSVIQ